MSQDAQNIKHALGKQARDMILTDLGRPVKDLAICWLHNEKTPSMSWDDNANHFHCFGCGGTYDIFNHYDIHKGLSFGEALRDLADMTGYKLQDTMAEPALRRKSRIEVSQDYTKKKAKAKLEVNTIDTFLRSRNIDADLARNVFGVQGTNEEIILTHYEVINGQWTDCFSKRRKLDKSMYEIDGRVSKEISIGGGTLCFFGLTSLYKADGEPKAYCIICEGQLDALRCSSALSDVGLLDLYAVLSVPNGANTLKTAIENSPTFNKWYRKCQYVILMPDNDEGGRKMVESAKEFLSSNKARYCNLSILGNSASCNDVSDYLDAGESIEAILETQDYIPIDNCYKSRDIDFIRVEAGFKSGFITHDYNDSGLKDGGLTLLTGKRGQGKTTLGRQFVMCAALQQIRSFCWFGEGNKEQENSRFARMIANQGEISSYDNGSGRPLFEPTEALQERFRSLYSDYIYFFEHDHACKENIFDNLLHMMKQNAIRGCKLFLLDNLMVMTSASGPRVFDDQKRIITDLKMFAKDYKVHVLLVVHPRKGDGYQSISGASEIENTADTILRYVRVDKSNAEFACEFLPDHEVSNISAMVFNEKVRDEGEANPFFLEWDKQKGIVREVTYIEELRDLSQSYFEQGWFSRYQSRIDINEYYNDHNL